LISAAFCFFRTSHTALDVCTLMVFCFHFINFGAAWLESESVWDESNC